MSVRLVVLMVLVDVACAGDGQASREQVASILEAGWGKSFRSLGPAEEAYRRVRRTASADPRVPFALALAHVKHHKYDGAKKLLDETMALDAGHLPSRRARIWIDVLLKEYPAALVALDRYSQLAAADADQVRRGLSARWLGRMFAFMQGPAEKAAQPERVKEYQQRVLRLPPTLRKEFHTARQALDDRFTQLWLTREQAVEDAKRKEQQSKQQELLRLAGERTAMAAQKQAIEQRRAELRKEVELRLSEIDKELAPLERSLSRLEAQAAPLRRSLARLQDQINRHLLDAERAENPAARRRSLLEARRLAGFEARQAGQYRALDAEAARLRAGHAALARQRAAAVNRYNGETQRLGKELGSLRIRERRLDKQEERNRRPPTGVTPAVAALSRQVFAFTTYVPFPLEPEKQRLLDSFR